ncbi:DUF2218 domain-containing protein [Rhodobacterales bacterium HKCCE3408]|nr:DUF2218 domain-containing protein [Rhodobacterales bacterium HKCCE3408]
MKSTVSVETPKASGYLQQLAKHFGHKRPVTFDAASGRIEFDGFTADLAADSAALTMTVTADTTDQVARGQDVLWRHLERFAFREDLAAPEWHAA